MQTQPATFPHTAPVTARNAPVWARSHRIGNGVPTIQPHPKAPLSGVLYLCPSGFMKTRLFSACVANQVHNLMILGDFVEHFQRAFRMLIIQIYKGVIQNQKRFLIAKEGIHKRQTHTQHNAIYRSRTETADFTGGAFSSICRCKSLSTITSPS